MRIVKAQQARRFKKVKVLQCRKIYNKNRQNGGLKTMKSVKIINQTECFSRRRRGVKRVIILALTLVLLLSMAACGSSDKNLSTETLDPDAAVPDKAATADIFVGTWNDITSSERFAKISAENEVITYEDNESKYEGTIKDGILTLKIPGGVKAEAFINSKNGFLIMTYLGETYEFQKSE